MVLMPCPGAVPLMVVQIAVQRIECWLAMFRFLMPQARLTEDDMKFLFA